MEKRYKAEARISEYVFETVKLFSDEVAFRELATKLVKEMEFKDLENLFSFTKTDPKAILKSRIRLPEYEYDKARELLDQRCVLYEIEVAVVPKIRVAVLSKTWEAYQEFLIHVKPIDRLKKKFELITRENQLFGKTFDDVEETYDFWESYERIRIYKFLEGRINKKQ
jgi:hypothetical protein